MTDNKDTKQNSKRIAIKEALARLMATENITVEHASVPTAAFDVVNRKLYIPLWKDISEDVYTLLISHEVGHALYTPGDDWKNKVIEGKDRNYKSVVNIIEDVRIEKLIQKKYPGATRSFKAGYSELEKKNLFGTRIDENNQKKIEEFGILDRINMHYKVGHYGYASVPFRPEEQPWLPRIDACETFDDVLKLSEELLKFAEQQPEYQPQEGGEEEVEIQAGSEEEAEALKKLLENGQPSDGKGKGNITVTFPSDVEAPENAESKDGEGKDKDGKENKSGNGKPSKRKIVITSLTQDSFDKKMEDFIDLKNKIVNVTVPKFELKKIIVDYKKVLNQLGSFYGGNDLQMAKAKEHLSHFKGNNKHVVNQLVNLFEMKKKAKSDSRALIAKTGVLDTNKIHGYRYNEDIFRKVTNIPGGKSHGLVTFIDMSGSMGSHMAGAYAQMINIAMFCRKVNIPFEVYGFSDNPSSNNNGYSYDQNHGSKIPGEVFLQGNFSLRNYLSNRMSQSEYNQMLEYLMCVISHYSGRTSSTYEYFQCGIPASEGLCGTPLNETIIAATQIVPEFRANYNLDFVHTCIITDGDGTSGLDYNAPNANPSLAPHEENVSRYSGEVFARHYTSRKMYHLTKDDKRNQGRNRYSTRDFTANLIEMYKEITGAKMIGFFICDKQSAKYTIQSMSYGETPDVVSALQKNFDDKQFAEVKKDGYDSYYIIPSGKDLLTSGEDIDFGDTTSKTVIQKKFLKAMSKKKNSRVLLGRFIDHIA